VVEGAADYLCGIGDPCHKPVSPEISPLARHLENSDIEQPLRARTGVRMLVL